MRINLFTLTCLILCTMSCAVEPENIEYGKDACHYCKMNIVDKTHAAQIVTKKGKVYKYDAVECMLNDLNSKDQSQIGLFLVVDYSKPEKLIDATTATFLISDSIQSPMGANLSAFEEKDSAMRIVKRDNHGILYTWERIQQHFYTR